MSEKDSPRQIITDREKLYLSLGDLLMIIMIIVDLLYLGNVIELPSNEVLFFNVFVVSISFVVYQIKKRVKKRSIREYMDKKDKEN